MLEHLDAILVGVMLGLVTYQLGIWVGRWIFRQPPNDKDKEM